MKKLNLLLSTTIAVAIFATPANLSFAKASTNYNAIIKQLNSQINTLKKQNKTLTSQNSNLNSQISKLKQGPTVDYSTQLFIDGSSSSFSLDGSTFCPILYNKQVYLPAKFISNFFGRAFSYDSSKKKVFIGSTDKTSLTGKATGLSEFRLFTDKSALAYSGGAFDSGYISGDMDCEHKISYTLGGKFQHLSLSFVKWNKSADSTGSLIVKDDNGTIYKEVDLSKYDSDKLIDIDADIKGANNISIYLSQARRLDKIIISNIYAH